MFIRLLPILLILLSGCSTMGREYLIGSNVIIIDKFYNGCTGILSSKGMYFASNIYYVDIKTCPNYSEEPDFDLVLSPSRFKLNELRKQ